MERSQQSSSLPRQSVLLVCALVFGLAFFFTVSQGTATPAEPTLNKNRWKKMAMAMLAYSDLNNGTLPLAFAPNTTTGGWRWNAYTPIPANWRSDQDAVRHSENAVAWANSIRPQVIGNPNALEVATYRTLEFVGAPYSSPNVPYDKSNMVMNGMLHQYPVASVAKPERLPLLWQGSGDVNLAGFAMANPTLQCPNPGPCVFNPTGPSQPGGQNTGAWLWPTGRVNGNTYTPTAIVTHHGITTMTVDGSLVHRLIGGDENDTQSIYDPFAEYTSTWRPNTMRFCIGQGSFSYPCVFRPDNLFAQ